MPMDSAALQHFAQRYTEAWNSHDPKCVAAFFSATGSLQINEAPPATGWPAIAAAAKQFMTAFPDLHVQMDNLVIHADHAIYHWTLTGTNTGTNGTGAKVRISGHETWHLSPEGQIAHSQGSFDQSDYNRQLNS
jgi:predicted ester cyclase